jgi:hypothetical protein
MTVPSSEGILRPNRSVAQQSARHRLRRRQAKFKTELGAVTTELTYPCEMLYPDRWLRGHRWYERIVHQATRDIARDVSKVFSCHDILRSLEEKAYLSVKGVFTAGFLTEFILDAAERYAVRDLERGGNTTEQVASKVEYLFTENHDSVAEFEARTRGKPGTFQQVRHYRASDSVSLDGTNAVPSLEYFFRRVLKDSFPGYHLRLSFEFNVARGKDWFPCQAGYDASPEAVEKASKNRASKNGPSKNREAFDPICFVVPLEHDHETTVRRISKLMARPQVSSYGDILFYSAPHFAYMLPPPSRTNLIGAKIAPFA